MRSEISCFEDLDAKAHAKKKASKKKKVKKRTLAKKTAKKRFFAKKTTKKQEKKETKREKNVKALFEMVEDRFGGKLADVLRKNDLDDAEVILATTEEEIGAICATIGLKHKMKNLKKELLKKHQEENLILVKDE